MSNNYTPRSPGISRETYQKFSTDNKLDALFDFTIAQTECLKEIAKRLERKKKIDMSVSAATGFVGGFVAMLAKWGLWK